MNIIPKFIFDRISHRPKLVKVLGSIGWLMIDKVCRMLVGLIVGVWLARYLGPEKFGLLSFTISYTALFGTIANLGLQNIVVRDIVNYPENTEEILGSAAVLQITGGLLSYLLMYIFIYFIYPEDQLVCQIVAILGFVYIFKFTDVAIYWFESQVQSKYIVWLRNIVFVIFSSIKIFMLLHGATIVSFVWAMLVEGVTLAILLSIVMNKIGVKIRTFKIKKDTVKILIKESWPLFLSSVAITVYMKIDQIMIAKMMNQQSVGIYSAAVKISEIYYFIPIIVLVSLFPSILDSKKINDKVYYTRLQKLFDFMSVVGISLTIITVFFADSITKKIYGNEYEGTGVILAIHTWATIFVFLGVASTRWYIAEKKQITTLKLTVIGALINILLNIILIPSYGVVGAAVSTLISYSVSAFLGEILFPESKVIFKMKLRSLNVIAALRRIL